MRKGIKNPNRPPHSVPRETRLALVLQGFLQAGGEFGGTRGSSDPPPALSPFLKPLGCTPLPVLSPLAAPPRPSPPFSPLAGS